VPARPAVEPAPAWLVAVPESVEVLLFAGGRLQGAETDHCPGQQVLQLVGKKKKRS